MSTTYVYARMEIAGKIETVKALEALVAALLESYVRLEDQEGWDSIRTKAEAFNAILEAKDTGLAIEADEAPFGELPALEDACKVHGLWYLKYNAADQGVPTMTMTYDPTTGAHHAMPDMEGCSFVELDDLAAVMERGEDLTAYVNALLDKQKVVYGHTMPKGLEVAQDIIDAYRLRHRAYKVTLRKLIEAEIMVNDAPDEEAAREMAEEVFSDTIKLGNKFTWNMHDEMHDVQPV